MTEDRSQSRDTGGLVGALLGPLRAPARVVADIERIASAVLALQRDARERLASVDERAGALLVAVGGLRAPLDRVDRAVVELARLEEAITARLDALDESLSVRFVSLEQQVHATRGPIERMARDLTTIVELLPRPSDGPLARLKDSLSAS